MNIKWFLIIVLSRNIILNTSVLQVCEKAKLVCWVEGDFTADIKVIFITAPVIIMIAVI